MNVHGWIDGFFMPMGMGTGSSTARSIYPQDIKVPCVCK